MIFASTVYSQYGDLQVNELQRNIRVKQGEKDFATFPVQEYYLTQCFSFGTVIQESDTIMALVNYNMIRDEFHIVNFDGDTSALVNSGSVKAVFVGDKHFEVHKFSGDYRPGIAEVLVDGRYKLYYKRKIHIIPAQEPGAYKEAKPASTELVTRFIVIYDGQEKVLMNEKHLKRFLASEEIYSKDEIRTVSLKDVNEDEFLQELESLEKQHTES